MSAKVEVKDDILYITGEVFGEKDAKKALDIFYVEHPGEKFNTVLDVEKVELDGRWRKKILNDVIKKGYTPKMAVVDPSIKINILIKIIRSTGKKNIKTFKTRDEAVEHLKGD